LGTSDCYSNAEVVNKIWHEVIQCFVGDKTQFVGDPPRNMLPA